MTRCKSVPQANHIVMLVVCAGGSPYNNDESGGINELGGYMIGEPQSFLCSKRVTVMSLDNILFVVIAGGVGLCVLNFRDEYIAWRDHRAAEMRKFTSRRR